MTGSPPDVISIGPGRLTAGLDRYERLDLAAHQAIFGPTPGLTIDELVTMAKQVDLCGRGGAAFPVARKLQAVADSVRQRRRPPVVVVNGTEGEPGSAKDKMLLLRSPYLVLASAVVAARALGARQIVVGVAAGGAHIRSVGEAVAADSGLKRMVRIVVVPDRFVSGESGALVNAINGRGSLPPGRKSRASDAGVDGLPTFLSTAGTLAQLAVLAMLGTEGYSTVGLADEPGTTLLSIGGSAGRPAVVETPLGVPLGHVLDICEARVAEGVLVGGYHGMWLTADAAATVPVSKPAWPPRAARWVLASCCRSAPAPARWARSPASPPTWPRSRPASAGRAGSRPAGHRPVDVSARAGLRRGGRHGHRAARGRGRPGPGAPAGKPAD